MKDSRKLPDELLSGVHTAVTNARKEQARVVISFGRQNTGMQIGVNHGAISGITSGKNVVDSIVIASKSNSLSDRADGCARRIFR